MTLSSLVNQSRAMLEEQARHLLTEAERQTMGYYVEEYRDGHIGVEQLVVALFELLNTHAKVKTKSILFKVIFFMLNSSSVQFARGELWIQVFWALRRFMPGLFADAVPFCFFPSSLAGWSLSSFSHSAVIQLVKKKKSINQRQSYFKLSKTLLDHTATESSHSSIVYIQSCCSS